MISSKSATPSPSGEFAKGGKRHKGDSPPTPHKIQSLDEFSLHLDENVVTISHHQGRKGRRQKALLTSQNTLLVNNGNTQEKTHEFIEEEKGKKRKAVDEQLSKNCLVRCRKLTDFFPQRRSLRKTKESINAENHKLLTTTIENGVEHGIEVNIYFDDISWTEFQVRYFPRKGRGVIATKKFTRNEYVVEYAGDLLTSAEAKDREDIYGEDSGTGCYMYYFSFNNQKYCIDATKESDRLGRLINHSRNGNLITKTVMVNGSPRLIFLAKRTIEVDEELSYDYGDRNQEAIRFHPWLAT